MHWKAVPGQPDILWSSLSLRSAVRHFWERDKTLIIWMYKKKNIHLTIYFPVWLGFQGVTSMFVSQCNYCCFHSLPISVSQPFGNPVKQQEKITVHCFSVFLVLAVSRQCYHLWVEVNTDHASLHGFEQLWPGCLIEQEKDLESKHSSHKHGW